MKTASIVTILTALLTAPAIAAENPVVIPEGQAVAGRCVGVHDGDSMTLLVDTPDGKRQSKIRLDAIDALELGQPFSNRSKQTLSGMVFDKECAVESLGPDKYGRTIGRIEIEGRDVNRQMVADRLAWHYKRFDNNPRQAAAEQAAPAAKRGLVG